MGEIIKDYLKGTEIKKFMVRQIKAGNDQPVTV